MDFYRRQREDYDGARPMWGDVARMDGDLPAATEAEKAAERMARLREGNPPRK